MKLNVIVISNIHIIRLNLLKKFKTLGFNVSTFSDIREPLQLVNRLNPDVVVLDEDGAEREWKIFISGLKIAKKKIIFILITSKISINRANEAVSLGVSGIILKPFYPEKHLQKILDIINRNYSIFTKRASPRFFLDPADQPEISYFSEKEDEQYKLLIVNISENGAAIRSLLYQDLEELQPGFRAIDATMTLRSITVNLSFRVVSRENDLIGITFEEITKGQTEFLNYIEDIYTTVFGTKKEKGRW